MELVKQKEKLKVVNHDYVCDIPSFIRHSALIGANSKRGLIIGKSGSGKTNALISLLTENNGLRYRNIYLYSKTINQPKYQFLKKVFEAIPEIGYIEYENHEDIIPPQEAEPYSVVIFDDVLTSNQNIIRDYFAYGRHYNLDPFYLAQTYSAIPKQIIRDNANFLVIFPQDETNLKHIYNDHGNQTGLSFIQFKKMAQKCWIEPFSFLVIDKESDVMKGRYRQKFDTFINP